MLRPDRRIEGDWYPHPVPPNVYIGENAYIESACSFKRMLSLLPEAIRLEAHSAAYAACQFALGPDASCSIGRFSLLNGVQILAEKRIVIGSHCLISWNVCIADTDFHPLDPMLRRLDAELLAPGGDRARRAPMLVKPVTIEDNVWIGFNASILKGVRIGTGAVVGAGAVVTRDVPACAVVAGNPARIIRTLTPEDEDARQEALAGRIVT